jgi:choline dehydrogenase-like flavoprotein
VDYDVIVVGSGFGGSVSALRLTEKGYRVGVLEAGPRRDERTLPKSSWRLRDYLWLPGLGLRGIQRVHVVRGTGGAGVTVLAGAGVGGSLVYANTLYVPPDKFFGTGEWAAITDWKTELAPYYGQAKRMLGVVTNPTTTPADRAMRQVAEDPGVAECMTGCRHGAKNMVTKNYLYLAEQAGAVVHPDTEVTSVRPLPNVIANQALRSRRYHRDRIGRTKCQWGVTMCCREQNSGIRQRTSGHHRPSAAQRGHPVSVAGVRDVLYGNSAPDLPGRHMADDDSRHLRHRPGRVARSAARDDRPAACGTGGHRHRTVCRPALGTRGVGLGLCRGPGAEGNAQTQYPVRAADPH